MTVDTVLAERFFGFVEGHESFTFDAQDVNKYLSGESGLHILTAWYLIRIRPKTLKITEWVVYQVADDLVYVHVVCGSHIDLTALFHRRLRRSI